jgi:hypothetical protein
VQRRGQKRRDEESHEDVEGELAQDVEDDFQDPVVAREEQTQDGSDNRGRLGRASGGNDLREVSGREGEGGRTNDRMGVKNEENHQTKSIERKGCVRKTIQSEG